MTRDEFTRRVLTVTADGEMQEDLWWNKEGAFCIRCSDVFAWGRADLEPLTPDNIGVLEATIADLRAIETDLPFVYAAKVFCSRVRKMRPQGAAYPEDARIWPLLDVCGPERVVGIGNPHPHPSKKVKP